MMTRAAGEGLRRCIAEHSPDLGAWRHRIVERCRHHADHSHRRAADGNRATDDRRIATKLALPQRVAEDDLEVVVRLIFLLEKIAAERRRDAECSEIRPGDAIADYDF